MAGAGLDGASHEMGETLADATSDEGAGLSGRASPSTALFLRAALRAALPWLAAAVVTATSLEPYLASRAPDPILFEDQTPPAPRRVPKSDPDLGHSFALYSV